MRKWLLVAILLLPPLGIAAWSGSEYLLFHGDVENIAFENGDVRLTGVLVKPSGRPPYPAVVFIHGSDPTPHDHPVWKVHANAFLRRGFAVVVYDKRGSGGSTGNLEAASMRDLAGDVAAAVRFLRDRPDVAPDRIGLFGRSQGGWVGPLATTLVDGVAFVVMSASPAVSPAAQGLYRMEGRLRDRGVPAPEIREALALRKRLWNLYRRSASEGEAALRAEREAIGTALVEMRKKDWFETADLPRELPPSDPEANTRRVAFYLHDPLPPLVRMNCPLLAVFGAEDRLVDTAESVAILERLKRERKKDITVVIYPHVGHALTTWKAIPTFYAPGYLDLIADWSRRQVDRRQAKAEEEP
ncbi:MAG TPA: CocE/NonD family hydrolase [Thermoanaerobaculia bacterium]|jgi:hypothetical protein